MKRVVSGGGYALNPVIIGVSVRFRKATRNFPEGGYYLMAFGPIKGLETIQVYPDEGSNNPNPECLYQGVRKEERESFFSSLEFDYKESRERVAKLFGLAPELAGLL